MGLSLKPDHLRRYREPAVLLLKYGRSDMVFSAGLGMDEPDSAAPPANGDGDKDLAAACGASWMALGMLRSDYRHTRRPT